VWPRIAFFSDSYHGVDGVATTCRNVLAAARRQGLPFLAVHAGPRKQSLQEGTFELLELPRGPLAFDLDRHLRFDLLFQRHFDSVLERVRAFRADIVHITGPGDIGITGARVAYALGLPLAAAWHTNLHEFAARRLSLWTHSLPQPLAARVSTATEESVLAACVRFYKLARVILAPNIEHTRLLLARTGRPVFPMRRGVDTVLFSPHKRIQHDGVLRLGYVGRLRAEKNVRFLADLETALRQDGLSNYRFVIVGEGPERAWLQHKLIQADFTGELHGEFLAEAYANMDVLVFPSETDTFGNVVLEAMASGVPAVVTSKGGPKYQVQDGVTGFVALDSQDFIAKVKLIMTANALRRTLRESSRFHASGRSWDSVLDDLHEAYREGLRHSRIQHPTPLLTADLSLRPPS
jgi:glycosyltransferase involved in cell wall biosynthesis